MSAILFDTASGNLLLGFIPESFGLLIFGITLVVFALCLGRIFDRNDEDDAVEKFDQTARKTNG